MWCPLSNPKKKQREVSVVPAGVRRARLNFKVKGKKIKGLKQVGDSLLVTYFDGTKETIKNAVPVTRKAGDDMLISTLFGTTNWEIAGRPITKEDFVRLWEAGAAPSRIAVAPVFRISRDRIGDGL